MKEQKSSLSFQHMIKMVALLRWLLYLYVHNGKKKENCYNEGTEFNICQCIMWKHSFACSICLRNKRIESDDMKTSKFRNYIELN